MVLKEQSQEAGASWSGAKLDWPGRIVLEWRESSSRSIREVEGEICELAEPFGELAREKRRRRKWKRSAKNAKKRKKKRKTKKKKCPIAQDSNYKQAQEYCVRVLAFAWDEI